MAHRPRAPARVDRRRTFGKIVHVTFSGGSKKKNIDFLSSENLLFFLSCLGPTCACLLCVRVCACLCVARVTLKTSPRVYRHHARGDVLNVHTAGFSACHTTHTRHTVHSSHQTHSNTQQQSAAQRETSETSTRKHERRDTSPEPGDNRPTQQTHKGRQRPTHETTKQRYTEHATRVTQDNKTRRDKTRQDETRLAHIYTYTYTYTSTYTCTYTYTYTHTYTYTRPEYIHIYMLYKGPSGNICGPPPCVRIKQFARLLPLDGSHTAGKQ